MLFDAQAKDRTRFFSLHIELIMWGDDFLDIDAENPAEPILFAVRIVHVCTRAF